MLLLRLRGGVRLASTMACLMTVLAARPAFAEDAVAAPLPVDPEPESKPAPAFSDAQAVRPPSPPDQVPASLGPLSAAVGDDHSAVSAQSLSMPQGAGKVQGMGES